MSVTFRRKSSHLDKKAYPNSTIGGVRVSPGVAPMQSGSEWDDRHATWRRVRASTPRWSQCVRGQQSPSLPSLQNFFRATFSLVPLLAVASIGAALKVRTHA